MGGLMVAVAEYFINKDTKNTKYVGIMVHGLPMAFLGTLILLNDTNKEKVLVKYGIYLSIIITGAMALLYFLLNSNNKFLSNKYYAIGITAILWVFSIYYYLQL